MCLSGLIQKEIRQTETPTVIPSALFFTPAVPIRFSVLHSLQGAGGLYKDLIAGVVQLFNLPCTFQTKHSTVSSYDDRDGNLSANAVYSWENYDYNIHDDDDNIVKTIIEMETEYGCGEQTIKNVLRNYQKHNAVIFRKYNKPSGKFVQFGKRNAENNNASKKGADGAGVPEGNRKPQFQLKDVTPSYDALTEENEKLRATEDGFIELSSGNYQEMRDLSERIYRETTLSSRDSAEEYWTDEGTDMWDSVNDKDRENGFGDNEKIRGERLQNESAGDDEYLRSGDRRESQFQLKDVTPSCYHLQIEE